MKRNLRCLMLLASLSLVLFIASCAREESRLTRVAVMGDANLQAQPDTAVLVISVVTQNKQAISAQQENARRSEAVIEAVKRTIGGELEINTSDYSLEPQQTYRSNQMPTIIGYEARNSVTVKVKELDKVGAVIDAASQAGANSIQSVSFILREDNPARGHTLAAATRQAMTKAQSVAQALGGRVVRVVEGQEGGTTRTLGMDENTGTAGANMNSNMSATSASYDAKRQTPMEAGSLNVRSQVQLVVEIEARP